jgi:transcriptional regulator with XRE-family HTH domain
MARAALRITVRDLAERTELDKGTIIRVESGAGAHALTLRQIRQVLEAAGVEFIDEVAGLSGPGIRLKWETTADLRKKGKGGGEEDESAHDAKLAAFWAAWPDRLAEFSDCGRESIHKTTHGEA